MNKVILFQGNKTSSDIKAGDRGDNFYSPANNSITQRTVRIHPLASVMGNVRLGKRVTIASGASVRGYEDRSIWIGDEVDVRDGAVIQALEAYHDPRLIEEAVVEVAGKYYGVYIGDRVFLTPQAQIHGPAIIGEGTYVGMQSLVFRATVGANCIIEPKALVMGVEIGDGRYVPAGALITTQAEANELPFINHSYTLKNYSRVAASTNVQSATAYSQEIEQSA